MIKNYNRLFDYINSHVLTLPHSRIHKLHTFGSRETQCFVKRDDELSFAVSGTKLRKYQSLLPSILKSGFENVALIGSAHSNNILSLTQLLIENGKRPLLFLKATESNKNAGNFLLSSLFVSKNCINWISPKEWINANSYVEDYVQKHKNTYLVYEGACQQEALAGALTLLVDIIENEQYQQVSHIFIDSGTGLTAIAMILGVAYLKLPIMLHIILLADDDIYFRGQLKKFARYFADELSWSFPTETLDSYFRLYYPSQAKSFGSTNSTIFKEIVRIAREEGILTDPIYSVKLFLKAQTIIEQQALNGGCLFIHSGGALSLMGFQQQIAKAILSMDPS